MTILRCFECNGLKYNGSGEPCLICSGTGFLTVVTREENTDRRVNQRRKRDRRKNRRRFFEEKRLPDK